MAEGRDGGAVKPAREAGAGFHIGPHAFLHRGAEQVRELLQRFLFADRVDRLLVEVEIPLHHGRFPFPDAEGEPMGGRQLEHTLVERILRPVHLPGMTQGQVVVKQRVIRLVRNPGLQQRPDAGCEVQSAACAVIVIKKRFLPEAVPCRKECLLPLIPDPEGEHAVKPVHAVLAPFGECCGNHFRVPLCAEGVSFRFQILPEFPVVVDLTVIDQ